MDYDLPANNYEINWLINEQEIEFASDSILNLDSLNFSLVNSYFEVLITDSNGAIKKAIVLYLTIVKFHYIQIQFHQMKL